MFGTLRDVLRSSGSGAFSRVTFAMVVGLAVSCSASAYGVPASKVQSDTSTTMPEYRLNVRDRVRVQVFEWRPSRDEIYSWTALNQIYTIDPAGKIYLPFAGAVSAVGYTAPELGTMISRQLAERLKLATLPNATVEVTDFHPIYVTGAVEKAGEYPFTAGMNVLQAVSLGGGLFRNSTSGGLRLEREYVTTAGSLKTLQQERQRLLAHKSRLDAELASSDRIAFPRELQSVGEPQAIEFTASVMSKEQSVFDIRQKANETQLAALNQLQSSLEAEVTTLDKRLVAEQKQIDLLKAELSGIQSLNDRGLATQPRLLGLKRNLAELEGAKLSIEAERTRAQQEVSRTKISKIEYKNKRDNDLTVELQTTEARLEQISQETTVNQTLLADTEAQATVSPLRMVSTGNEDSKAGPKIHYTIVRQYRDGAVEIEATEKTTLQPGDTVKVDVSMPQGFDPLGVRGLEASFSNSRQPQSGSPARSTVIAPKAPTSASAVTVEPISDMLQR